MKKRVFSIVIVALMLMSLMMSSASAASTSVTVTVGSVSGVKGEIVGVPVSISANSYLVNTDLHITYDTTKLKLVEYYEDEEGELACYSTAYTVLDSSWMYMGNEKTSGDFMFVAATGKETGLTAGGELFRLAFEILSDEGTVAVNVSADPINGNDGSGEPDADGFPADYALTLNAVNGTVEVETVLKGDVTSDGFVNMLDVMALYNSTSGKVTLNDAQKAAADVTNDGVVNMLDVMALYNKISGK